MRRLKEHLIHYQKYAYSRLDGANLLAEGTILTMAQLGWICQVRTDHLCDCGRLLIVSVDRYM